MARPMTAPQTLTAMKKWGVPYREYPGWKTRGRPASTGPFSDVRGIVIHHTGSDAGQSDAYLKFLFVDGRSDLPGPLCNTSTDMDGDLWLGAAGRANHAGKGSSGVLGHVTNEDYAGTVSELRPGPDTTDGNAHFYGNEVRYDGGQPMTAKQYAAATRWAAAVCDFHGWSALAIIGHREWTSRKPDPGHCPMNKFRSDVAALLKAGPGKKPPTGPTPTPPKKDQMTPEQMQDLKDFITASNKLYAIATNNYTRQVLATATESILAAAGDDDAVKAIADLNTELDQRDAEAAKDLDDIATKVDALPKA